MFENDLEQLLNSITIAECFQITGFSELCGGSINRVLLFETTLGRRVIKMNEANYFPSMFAVEKEGLILLGDGRTFVVPEVFFVVNGKV